MDGCGPLRLLRVAKYVIVVSDDATTQRSGNRYCLLKYLLVGDAYNDSGAMIFEQGLPFGSLGVGDPFPVSVDREVDSFLDGGSRNTVDRERRNRLDVRIKRRVRKPFGVCNGEDLPGLKVPVIGSRDVCGVLQRIGPRAQA